MMRYLFQLLRGCRRDHLWFPDEERREFIPVTMTCLRCMAARRLLPWGECLGGHPLADHYDENGDMRPLPDCWGPQ